MLLLSRCVHPKIVVEMLGHTTISMTLDIYSDVTLDMQQEAVDIGVPCVSRDVGASQCIC